ncbi:aminopeptidase P N-terminal domain-containing protein [Olivibacter sp. SDN3]|uniref:aminopeptidase P family protein n=1 Tax=Olivibacter sp. SDN3 TaxID=2764720 RepID=UPI001651AAAE|nr:aminopeptidase P family protein [Olivibacter sp. SDN3]QNL50749.1 aminopeptidase P N-terminal domain-containing protein [Olivibacter sp. SDN3]
MFSTDTYKHRRRVLGEEVGSGVLLFLGNEESPMNYADNTFPFRQDSTFLYYFGIQEPKLVAIIDIDENRTILFGDELSIDDIIWMGRQETLTEKGFKSGIDYVYPSNELPIYLKKAQQQERPVHLLPPYRAENKISLWGLLGVAPQDTKHKASTSFIQAVVAQRSIKSSEEIIEIEKAVNTSVEMHLLAMNMVRPGVTELQIANAVQALAQNSGGALAYPTILSIHGEILHNHKHVHTLQAGQLILHDSGAETAMGYAGDLTRTFPVSDKFTDKQKEVYDVVRQALLQASDQLAPGIRFLDIHFTACRALVEGLKSIGLMHGNTEEAVAAGAHTLFFQCGTGHMMGLDVHDMEDLGEQYVGYTDSLKKDTETFGLKSLRLGKELVGGYVLTVEPGIYFIPELIDLWKSEDKLEAFINYQALEQYRDFGGIRLEDNFLITGDGHRKLGNALPTSIQAIEDIKQQRAK